MKEAYLYKNINKKIPLEKYKKRIKYLYFKEKLSLKNTAREIGVCPATIRNNMVAWGMPRRETTRRDITWPSKEKLEKFYINKKLSMGKTSEIFGVGITTVFRWLHGYNIPVRKFKYKKYNFSEDPREKAYILGLTIGDLHVYRNYRQISVELSTSHPAMIDLFYSVFQKYGTPKKYLKYNRITKRYGWGAYVLLNNSFEFMLSKNFDIDNKYFYSFLAGFFDSEGCLHIYNNHNYIGLTALIYNSNKNLLEIIKEKLERDGFHPKFSRFFKKGEKTTNNYFRGVDLWTIRLHTNKEVLSLMNIMPIKHKEKLDKLKIAASANSNRWEEISGQVNNLRTNIKKEIKEYIKPKNNIIKNEGSIII